MVAMYIFGAPAHFAGLLYKLTITHGIIDRITRSVLHGKSLANHLVFTWLVARTACSIIRTIIIDFN